MISLLDWDTTFNICVCIYQHTSLNKCYHCLICSAGDKFNDFMNTNAIVDSNGFVLWLVPALIKTYCTLDVRFFPFDEQKCTLEFISWTHSGHELDVVYNNSFKNMVYYVATNQEWSVKGITAERHEKQYACCTEPYPDVTFTIHMRRGSLFYIFNLIFPCFLIYLVSFLGFFLPVESGEKVNLEITILLALVVFLLMVGETLPPTPDAIPILGTYKGVITLTPTHTRYILRCSHIDAIPILGPFKGVLTQKLSLHSVCIKVFSH